MPAFTSVPSRLPSQVRNDGAAAVGVPVGDLVQGAITSGPAQIGNFNVVGDVSLPGSFTVTGTRYQVLNKVLQCTTELVPTVLYKVGGARRSINHTRWIVFACMVDAVDKGEPLE